MKMENLKPIKLTSGQIEIMYRNIGEEPKDREEIPGFEGWSIDTDTSTGKYDGEKGSMYDYEIYLYNPQGELMGTAIGGYYNGGCGEKFSRDLTFDPPEPETPLSKFNVFLDNLCHEHGTLQDKISKVKSYIEKLEA